MEILCTCTMTVITKGLLGQALFFPQNKERTQGRYNISSLDRGNKQAIHTCVRPVATNMQIIQVLTTSNQANIAHIGTGTTVRAASHTYTDALITQTQFLQFGLDFTHYIR